MKRYQSGILAAIPSHAEHLYFDLNPEYDIASLKLCLKRLAESVDGEQIVVGLSLNLCTHLQRTIPGLKNFDITDDTAPLSSSNPRSTHNSNADLWCWLRSSERSQLFLLQRELNTILSPCFRLTSQVPTFCYQNGRDLTGYEDGTENPQDDAALATAFLQDAPVGLQGSSFVVTQQWQHRFAEFDAMTQEQRDHTIGRRRENNEELEEAPESAHVKRTAQEDFTPEAFVLRRSMPWMNQGQAGLLFAAFATSFDPFEAQFRRMLGHDDGISDALFNISTPLNTHYFWCPPSESGRLDLRALLSI
ncbi:Dyp-type peroxidase [Undibacterium cyanobacteriorum]|uniref:Dyp-type peroxidase n=1 Tax=Undibacterium cyanobacteriorum TaxID=3073561 RepID=A0ABY9RKH9_9BURK|nr:Dyp-type peroxidase [Undibacterium sp. 20NA77.5]WMW81723.1 Dyp-type peroxidase [Undibacterium sp. 20NA77.5]